MGMANDSDPEMVRAFGVPFNKYDGPRPVKIRDELFLQLHMAAGIIPILGVVPGMAQVALGLHCRHDNDYDIDRTIFRSGVYTLAIQAVALLLVALIRLM